MAKKSQRTKNGAWFIKVRGSYLPKTPQAWLLEATLLLAGLLVIAMTLDDGRPLLAQGITMVLSLIGLAAIFTAIAAKKS